MQHNLLVVVVVCSRPHGPEAQALAPHGGVARSKLHQLLFGLSPAMLKSWKTARWVSCVPMPLICNSNLLASIWDPRWHCWKRFASLDKEGPLAM